jgi:ABC-type uncharacterized transport system permease subunit
MYMVPLTEHGRFIIHTGFARKWAYTLFSVQPLCALSFIIVQKNHHRRHRAHRGCTEKNSNGHFSCKAIRSYKHVARLERNLLCNYSETTLAGRINIKTNIIPTKGMKLAVINIGSKE